MPKPPILGLRENARQFALLLAINAFIGAVVGVERSILPLVSEAEFGVASRTALLAFVASFGAAKATANLVAGLAGDRFGRKPVLLIGWLFALPVPWLLATADSWNVVVFANVLLGFNQGLSWSTTVIMKIDLVGPRQRGLAMGLNEAVGYGAVAAAALAAGYLAAAHGLRPAPFVLAQVCAVAGFALSIWPLRETRGHADVESAQHHAPAEAASFRHVLLLTSWRDRTLFSISQAGLVNNLNDGVVWGLAPILMVSMGQGVAAVGWLAALYPATWGLFQLVTGHASDRLGRKPLIVGGMLVQAVGLVVLASAAAVPALATAMVLLGIGTACVYPTFVAVISDVAHPSWRATSVGVYRLWRDGGYVVGALGAGLVADAFGLVTAIGVVAGLTAISGLIAGFLMRETVPRRA